MPLVTPSCSHTIALRSLMPPGYRLINVFCTILETPVFEILQGLSIHREGQGCNYSWEFDYGNIKKHSSTAGAHSKNQWQKPYNTIRNGTTLLNSPLSTDRLFTSDKFSWLATPVLITLLWVIYSTNSPISFNSAFVSPYYSFFISAWCMFTFDNITTFPSVLT